MDRPRLDIEKTFVDRLAEALTLAGVFALWIYPAIHFKSLPDIIPVHFSAAGEADGYGHKAMLWALPAIGTLLAFGLLMLTRIPHWLNYPTAITPENAERQYRLAGRLLRVMALAMVAVFFLVLYTTIDLARTGSGKEKDWLLPVILALVLTPSAFFIKRMIKNK